MSLASEVAVPLRQPDKFFIGGAWRQPSSDAAITVIDSTTELPFMRVAEAQPTDMSAAIAAARSAFDEGPWPRMSHAERAAFLRAFARALRARSADVGQLWPREAGGLHTMSASLTERAAGEYEFYAGLADSYPFEEQVDTTSGGAFGLLVREPVGVVGAIVPWNSPVVSISHKLGPALISGCTIILKSAPEAPGEALLAAEIAEEIGLPPGVLNVVTADRQVSELLVRDPRVDKISFTGSTAAGRRIASICGERVARCTLELGGKSAAVVLDDADIAHAAQVISQAECAVSGQVCASLTRIVVTRGRHDELVDALAAAFGQIRVGDPYDAATHMGPLATETQRDRVEGYIAKGVAEGAHLVTGGRRPKHMTRGYYVEPTIFGGVDNSSVIAQEEIFGPVLSVIPAQDEADAVRIANDSIYGLNASVFTQDPDRARSVAGQLRSGTVGQNAFRVDFGIAFGGFKQSGIGREGGKEAITYYTEAKTVVLDGPPVGYRGKTAPEPMLQLGD